MRDFILKAESFELYSPTPRLLQKLSFTLARGQVLFLLGPNGAGKSTFLRHVFAASSFRAGDALWLDDSLSFAYLPQSVNKDFFVPLTLKELSELSGPTSYKLVSLLPKGADKKLWNDSSGGERQRTLLVQALSQNRDVYLLDEPFNHLDASGVDEVARRIADFAQSRSKSFVIATHVVPRALSELGTELHFAPSSESDLL